MKIKPKSPFVVVCAEPGAEHASTLVSVEVVAVYDEPLVAVSDDNKIAIGAKGFVQSIRLSGNRIPGREDLYMIQDYAIQGFEEE